MLTSHQFTHLARDKQMLRWFLILIANLAPSKTLRRVATHLCNSIRSYPEEEGVFRNDVALCAFGILRQGDIEGFEYWVARYPFPEKWLGYPHLLCIDFIDRRWKAFGLNTTRNFGKAKLIACPHNHFATRLIASR